MNTTSRDMLIATVDPDALLRAERLDHAMRLIRGGVPCREANRILRDHYGISRWTAWRLLDMARDMA